MSYNFAEKRNKQNGIVFASGLVDTYEKVQDEVGPTLFGVRFFEGLVVKPRKGHIIGLLAGPGVGKTTTSAIVVGDTLLDERNKGYVVIVSLEMTKDEYLEVIMTSFGNDYPELLDRLIIIDCYEADGADREMSAVDIKLELKKIKMALGNDPIDLVVVDHFHETYNNGHIDYNPVAKDYKGMAKELDTIVLLPSQTTKEKGAGDIPVPKNGCYGCSKFENLCSHIFTIFQPLRRVQNECTLKALGWQLSKIRWKRDGDKTKEEINYVYRYIPQDENFAELTNDEKLTFQMYFEKVLELRDAEEKKKSYSFDLSSYIKGKNGESIKVEQFVGKQAGD